jgi:hypothetical protein
VVESSVAPKVAGGARVLSHLAPPKLREGFVRSYEQVQRSWGNLFRKGAEELPKSKM